MLDPHEVTKATTTQEVESNPDVQQAEDANDNVDEAQMIDQPQLNLNCSYDFRPTNFNFLLLSRFSFATKKRRI